MLSLSLCHLPPNQMGARLLQGDAEVVQRGEEESKATVRMWVRNNTY